MEGLSGQSRHIPVERSSRHVCNFSLNKWHPPTLQSVWCEPTHTTQIPWERNRGSFTHKFGRWLLIQMVRNGWQWQAVRALCPWWEVCCLHDFYPKITCWIWSWVDQITPTGKSFRLRPGQHSASLLWLWIRRDVGACRDKTGVGCSGWDLGQKKTLDENWGDKAAHISLQSPSVLAF